MQDSSIFHRSSRSSFTDDSRRRNSRDLEIPALSPPIIIRSDSGEHKETDNGQIVSESYDVAGLDPEATYISLDQVEPVNVSVRNLTITVLENTSMRLPWQNKDQQRHDSEREANRGGPLKILNDISADMPAGQLMAIIGGSGSGKVIYSHYIQPARKG